MLSAAGLARKTDGEEEKEEEGQTQTASIYMSTYCVHLLCVIDTVTWGGRVHHPLRKKEAWATESGSEQGPDST